MAMTATISASPTTALVNQPVALTVTVSNSGGSALNVTSLRGYALPTGGSQPGRVSANFGKAPLGPGETVSVAASGSQTFLMYVVFFAPSVTTFDVGCYCQASDGSQFEPTVCTVTVNVVPNS